MPKPPKSSKPPPPSAALLAALEAAGGQSALADKLGISRQRLAYWLAHGVPWREVGRVEKALGLPRSKIRPDVYPPEREKSAARQ